MIFTPSFLGGRKLVSKHFFDKKNKFNKALLPTSLPFGAEISGDGLWCQVLNRPQKVQPGPALFLDRDGVIVEEVNYLKSAKKTKVIKGAVDTIALANKSEIPVIIVTNQSGIGRGLYGWEEFIAVQEKILDELASNDCFINGVFACPHHEKGREPYNNINHNWRKPNPGMLTAAAAIFPIQLSTSWVIGDKASDLDAGKRAGLNGGLLVLTGHGNVEREKIPLTFQIEENFKVILGESIADAPSHLPIFS